MQIARMKNNIYRTKNNLSSSHPVSLEEWSDQKWRKEREDWRALVGDRSDKPPRYIAIHEAGHAVASFRFRYDFWVVKLNPRSGALVPRNYYPRDEDYNVRRAISLRLALRGGSWERQT